MLPFLFTSDYLQYYKLSFQISQLFILSQTVQFMIQHQQHLPSFPSLSLSSPARLSAPPSSIISNNYAGLKMCRSTKKADIWSKWSFSVYSIFSLIELSSFQCFMNLQVMITRTHFMRVFPRRCFALQF